MGLVHVVALVENLDLVGDVEKVVEKEVLMEVKTGVGAMVVKTEEVMREV